MQQLQPLRRQLDEEIVTPVTLPPGRFRLATRPDLTGSPPCVKTIGIVVVAALAASAAGRAGRDDHGHLRRTRSAASAGKSIVLALRPAILDRHVPALDIAGFAQALAERGQQCATSSADAAAEEPDHRHRRLLRARRERPRRRRAAEQRDELAASDESCHLIPPAGRATEG